MIRLTRLNGTEFAVNPDLLQRAEATPDTVVTLVDGSRYVVTESLEAIAARVAGFRATVVRLARGEDEQPAPPPLDRGVGTPDTDVAPGDVVEIRPRRT